MYFASEILLLISMLMHRRLLAILKPRILPKFHPGDYHFNYTLGNQDCDNLRGGEFPNDRPWDPLWVLVDHLFESHIKLTFLALASFQIIPIMLCKIRELIQNFVI